MELNKLIIYVLFSFCFGSYVCASQGELSSVKKKAQPQKDSSEINTQKKDDLEKKLLGEATEKAIVALKSGNLTQLDPCVGEWKCHERVLWTIKLFKDLRNGIQFTDRDKEFIGLSYLLTQSKVRRKKADLFATHDETIDRTKFSSKITSKKAKSCIQKSQSRLSHMTVDFMQHMAKSLNDPQLTKALTLAKVDDTHFNRLHCPFYPGFKVFLNGALHHGVPLCVKIFRHEKNQVHERSLFYAPRRDSYQPTERLDSDPLTPFIVVEGTSGKAVANQSSTDRELNYFSQLSTKEFIEAFKKLNIVELLLHDPAVHQQFAGKENAKTVIPFKEHGLEALQAEMHESQRKAPFGFQRNSDGGPYIFVIDHIYPSTAQEHAIINDDTSLPTKIPDDIEIAILDNNADHILKWAQLQNNKNAVRANGTSLLSVLKGTHNTHLVKSFLDLEPNVVYEDDKGKNGMDEVLDYYRVGFYNWNVTQEILPLVYQTISLYLKQKGRNPEAIARLKIVFQRGIKQTMEHNEELNRYIVSDPLTYGCYETLLKHGERKIKILESIIASF